MKQVHKSIEAQAAKKPGMLLAVVLVAYVVIGCAMVSASGSEEPENETIGIVIDALKGNDESMQSMAISLIRDMPGAEVTRNLARELPNLSVRGQVQLLSALADRGDQGALPAVIVATSSKDQSVQIAALKALGQLGNASSVDLLAEKAAAAGGEEQKAARESLYRLRDPNVDEVILTRIPKVAAQIKVELIKSLGERNIVMGVEVLLKTARDEDAKVRQESLKVLKTIAGAKYLPALVELLVGVQSTADRREAEKTVTAVAHKISDKNRQAEAVLAKLPSVKEEGVRCSLLRVLGKIGDDSALAVLRAGLKDKSDAVKDACIRALAEWPTAAAAADLLKVVQATDNKLHHVLALRGHVRLIGLDSNRPAEETIGMYKQAMSLASDIGEKKMVLSGLANIKSLAALEMAVAYLEDKALQQEAEVAVVKIAEATSGSHPAESKAALQKVIQASKNDFLRQKAQEAIKQIKEE
ncbi:MAG: HEAT repeat domain-containing protein [Phycisphaerae bacterium]|nr:HEAT repeat domain-containing protein [Phycisphaerae bacterium]